MNLCEICNAPVSVRPSCRPAGRFCSLRCVGVHRHRLARLRTVTCPLCRTVFVTRRRTAQFCSRKCIGQFKKASHSEMRTCEGCGANFERPKHVTKHDAAVFCSQACYWMTRVGERHHSFKDGLKAFDPRRFQQHASVVRRQRMKAAPGRRFTRMEWLDLTVRHDFRCLKCGRREPVIVLEPDHIVPIAHGGSKSIDNIQPLCRGCNRRKSAKTADYRRSVA